MNGGKMRLYNIKIILINIIHLGDGECKVPKDLGTFY